MTNKQLVETFYRAFDENQPELLNDTLTVDWKPLPPVPNNPGGLEGQKATVLYLHSIFSDFSYQPLEIIEAGETVVARAQLSGVQVGEFLGVGATNKKIFMETIEIHKVADGKIAATHHIEDFFGAYMQMINP